MDYFETITQNGRVIMSNGAVGIDGRPVTRTKQSHPYGYDAYLVYGNINDPANSDAYSDRMMQWDYDKFDKALQEAFGNTGQFFNTRTAEDIEKFLQIYFEDEKLELVRYFEGCNVSNGYPYWFFCFNLSDKK